MLAPKGGVVEDVLDGGMIFIDPAQDVHSSFKRSWPNQNLQPGAFQNKMHIEA
jgi:hypothetical protein